MGYFLIAHCFMLMVMVPNSCVAKVELPPGAKPLNHQDSVRYRDCGELRKAGYNASGVHTLYVNSTAPFLVHCEFTSDNGYTVIQRRRFGNVNFIQNFQTYANGFGYASGDFWVGLTYIHSLTQSNSVLYIYMQDLKGNVKNARYSSFTVGPYSDRFRLSVGGFSGTPPSLADDLTYHSGMPFQTYDYPGNTKCAVYMRVGWWYNNCTSSLLNGRYYNPPAPYVPSGSWYDGIYWKDWEGPNASFNFSLTFVQMTVSAT